MRKPPRLRRLYGGGVRTVSGTGPLARPREGFARIELRGRRSTFARSSIDFVAGTALSQGQVSISWQAQHFRKVLRPLSASWGMARCRKSLALCVNWASGLCANHLGCDACTEAVSERSRRRAHWHGRAKVSQGLNCVAGAALSQGQV